jgi:fibronectin type 3 domain-containing protein
MVFFHYPLRVDQNNYTTQQDVYLQNSAANPTGAATSLEALLSAHHVNLVFNGHAHLYERNVAPPGGVPSYVTGGGGAVLTNVAASSACSPTDAYARGWDPTHSVGSSCGSPSSGGAAKPSAAAQVYHFLKISVSGADVTVDPTDSTGAVFDPVAYHFAADTSSPSTPGAPTALRGTGSSSGNVTVTLGAAATDNVGVVAYDIYRDGSYRATVPAAVTRWTDVGVPGGTHTWTVKARDQRDNASTASAVSNAVTLPDTTAPTPPGRPVAQVAAGAPHTVGLSWAAATDDVGVTSYRVLRNGAVILTGVTGTSASDTNAADATSYTYTVTAVDAAGNVSAPSPATTVTTLDWTPPSPPTLSATAGPPNEIDLSWSGASDNVAVTSYDVYRDGSAAAAAQGITSSTWADTGLAAGSTHSYVVVARDAAGNSSPPSNSVVATVGATTVPVGPPTSLVVKQLATPGQVSVSWSPPTTGSAASYSVYRGTQQLTSGTTSTSFIDIAAPDSLPGVYTVTAVDSSGNTASATAAITPDWTAPTAPSGPAVTASSTTTATITWSAATDAVGVAGYSVTRTDSANTSVTISAPTTTLSDTGLIPGATYRYAVTASDAAGNTSSPSTATTLVVPVFMENFELGSLAPHGWTTPTAGLTLQQATVHSGSWAAEEVSTGSATWASAQLPSTYRAIHASAWVYIASRTTSAGFLKLRTASGAYIAYLYVNSGGYLSVRNDAGNVTHVSTALVSTGRWHKVEMYIDINPGGPITITAALDGLPVVLAPAVSSTETLGTSLIGQVVLGDTVAGRTYDVAVDDLTVDTQSP